MILHCSGSTMSMAIVIRGWYSRSIDLLLVKQPHSSRRLPRSKLLVETRVLLKAPSHQRARAPLAPLEAPAKQQMHLLPLLLPQLVLMALPDSQVGEVTSSSLVSLVCWIYECSARSCCGFRSALCSTNLHELHFIVPHSVVQHIFEIKVAYMFYL